tara:strand:+ start:4894 stop:5286 length:393 start_codon:yes stop_codon:yes gene_type:complete
MKIVHKAGKRKRAIAKATLRPGTGKIIINKTSLDNYQPEMSRLKIKEPLVLAGDVAKKFDINVRVTGGGFQSQTDAARLAIGRCLAETNKALKTSFLKFDRQLIVADTRIKEQCKPNDSKARSKRQKSYR